jgi:hypothetical protein
VWSDIARQHEGTAPGGKRVNRTGGPPRGDRRPVVDRRAAILGAPGGPQDDEPPF